MLSKPKISLINSLNLKKYRDKHNLFIAEGDKIVSEIINSNYKVKSLFYTQEKSYFNDAQNYCDEIILISNKEMQRISQLKTPTNTLAIVEKSENEINFQSILKDLCLVYEDLQNPGNLGTIIRVCDWFGIKNIVLSENSVDLFNPKVIQATMGSFLRVNIFYNDIFEFIKKYKTISSNPCYGTYMNGNNIYKEELQSKSLIVFGNEGKGISPELSQLLDKKITIPPYNSQSEHSESLNIAIASSIICNEFRRIS